jgi:inactivated superfamily I helicase
MAFHTAINRFGAGQKRFPAVPDSGTRRAGAPYARTGQAARLAHTIRAFARPANPAAAIRVPTPLNWGLLQDNTSFAPAGEKLVLAGLATILGGSALLWSLLTAAGFMLLR